VLVRKARTLLAPTLLTLASRKFLFGETPTLADAALYGVCKMLDEADPQLLPQVAESLGPFMQGIERFAHGP
jgi:glutathione S-transferase